MDGEDVALVQTRQSQSQSPPPRVQVFGVEERRAAPRGSLPLIDDIQAIPDSSQRRARHRGEWTATAQEEQGVKSQPAVSISMRDVKVTLAGDAGVGKSSLVTALVRDSFSPRVQHVVPEILLPVYASESGASTRIVDTSLALDKRAHLDASLRSASVIVLVYSISSDTSFDRIPTYWLPYLRSLGIKDVPVILVGNKIDLRQDDNEESLEDELAPVMAEFKEVESCIETSVKEGVNVSEVFYYAQKAVLYPTSPLYDSKTHALKESCVAALRRIFILCDSDKDHLLDDDEINDFQRRCFGNSLSPHEIQGIKDLVRTAGPQTSSQWPPSRKRQLSTSKSPASSSGSASIAGQADTTFNGSNGMTPRQHPNLIDNKLTLAGWLHLHTLFIQRGRLETTWTILQSFGYGADLTLDPEYLSPPTFAVPSDCAVELSPYGYSFLTDIFEAHDHDQDGSLCEEELNELFSTAPAGKHPWQGTGFPVHTTATNENGAVTLQGWLAQWSMTTLLDYKVTLAYLAYLGYPNFTVTEGMQSGPATTAANLGAHKDFGGIMNGGKEGPRAKGSRGKAKDAGRPSPPPTTSALKLARRDARLAFSSSWSSPFTTSSSASSRHGQSGKGNPSSSAKKKRKKGELADRCVFLAYVIGPPRSGKSSLLDSMLGKRTDGSHTSTSKPRTVVSAVEPYTASDETTAGLVLSSNGGYERYLILQEISTGTTGVHSPSLAGSGGSRQHTDSLTSTAGMSNSHSSMSIGGDSDAHADQTAALLLASKNAHLADVVIFVFDSSDTTSFSYISNVRQRFAATLGTLPTLIVANKADLDEAQQRHEVQPDVYCRKLAIERFSPWKISLAPHGDSVGDGIYHAGANLDIDGIDGAPAMRSPGGSLSRGKDWSGAVTTSPSISSVGDLIAVACAIAQDPSGNGAIPGARGRGQSSGGWINAFLSLFGMSSMTDSSTATDGSEDAANASGGGAKRQRRKSSSYGDAERIDGGSRSTGQSGRKSRTLTQSNSRLVGTFGYVGGASISLAVAYCLYHWYRYKALPLASKEWLSVTRSGANVPANQGSIGAVPTWWSWAQKKLSLAP
ncbi:unnamed protein product [Parajaminaea phylloscopi]